MKTVDVFTVGARSIIGKMRGFIAHVKVIAQKLIDIYCIICHQTFIVKLLKTKLCKVDKDGTFYEVIEFKNI